MNSEISSLGKAAAMPAATVPPGLLWRLPTVLEQYPESKTGWYRGMREGRYPRPVKLGKRAVAWRAADVLALVEQRLSSAE